MQPKPAHYIQINWNPMHYIALVGLVLHLRMQSHGHVSPVAIWAITCLLWNSLGNGAPPGPSVQEIRQAQTRQAKIQADLAERWKNTKDSIDTDERIKLAIECMRADTDFAPNIYNTKTGLRLTRQAARFLVRNDDTALPDLRAFVETHEPQPLDSRLENVYNVLGEIRDREVIIPLVTKFLGVHGPGGKRVHKNLSLENALARIGDADLVPQLLRLYPYENTLIQDGILHIISFADLPEAVPTLVRWAQVSLDMGKAPPSPLIKALAHQTDARAADTFRETLILPEPNPPATRFYVPYLYALYGLSELGEDFNHLELTLNQRLILRHVRLNPYTLTRYLPQHAGPNPELRTLIDKRLADTKGTR